MYQCLQDLSVTLMTSVTYLSKSICKLLFSLLIYSVAPIPARYVSHSVDLHHIAPKIHLHYFFWLVYTVESRPASFVRHSDDLHGVPLKVPLQIDFFVIFHGWHQGLQVLLVTLMTSITYLSKSLCTFFCSY